MDYIDGAGIGLLAPAIGKSEGVRGNLVLATVPGRVMDMLQLRPMILLMTVCGTVTEAELTRRFGA